MQEYKEKPRKIPFKCKLEFKHCGTDVNALKQDFKTNIRGNSKICAKFIDVHRVVHF